MKIIHTADLHLGQIIYQNYDRKDEHNHFFEQLTQWCKSEQPDALIVSGDIYDIQQPSAATRKVFNDYFSSLHNECPNMKIVITAGNHDSASRIHADSAVWQFANTTLIGMPPADSGTKGWENQYIVRLPQGYIIAIPYLASGHNNQIEHLLQVINEENTEGKPVVMMGHAAVVGVDFTGHDSEIGHLATQDASAFGEGYDYLALGHIHKPQTIGHQDDVYNDTISYPSPVIRYSGSALHVSCDEAYPHTVSVVEIDKHGGTVTIKQLRINELRHFYTLPEEGAFKNAEEALKAIDDFKATHKSGYIRLKIIYSANLPADFNKMVYDKLAPNATDETEEYRYNPKIIWEGVDPTATADECRPTFEIAELQEIKDPVIFIEKTLSQYPNLDMDVVREVFKEVEKEMNKEQ